MVGRALSIALAASLLLPALSAAQRDGAGHASPSVIHHNPPAPTPHAPPGRSQPPQSQSIPPIPLMSPTINTFPLGTVDLYQARRGTYSSRNGRFSQYGQYGQPYLGGYGAYGYGLDYYADAYATRANQIPSREAPQPEGFGYLRLQIEPASAHVYIDGQYVGIVDDFDGVSAGRSLDAGPHRVEIRADGFEGASFDVRVSTNQTVSYRRSLNRIDQRADLRASQAPPKTFYVIPGCYAGDVQPRPEQLPRGCNVAKVRAIPPVTGVPAR